jgi:phasin
MTAAKSARGKFKYAKTGPAAAAPASSPAGEPDAPAASPGVTARETAQSKESYEKMNATTAEAAELIKQICAAAATGAQDYNARVIAFAQANTVSAVDFARQLANVTSPSDFMKLSSEYNRKQFETLTAQTKALAAIAQRPTRETTDPLKAGFAEGPDQAA